MSNHRPGAAVAAGCGVSFVLTGIALLLQELGLLTLHWSLVLPVVLMATGLVVLVTGLAGAHRAQRLPTAQPPS